MEPVTEVSPEIIPRLHRRLNEVAAAPAHKILSPTIQPRRASIAIIIRVVPTYHIHPSELLRPLPTSVDEFFNQRWVQDGSPEILYIRRAHSKSDRWSLHMAFPGGTREKGDKDDAACAARETYEEIGYDLTQRQDFLFIGELDDREVTSSFGRRLLMVLSPFVYVQLTPPRSSIDGPIPRAFQEPKLQPDEVDSIHWIPFSQLVPCRNGTKPTWSEIKVEVVTRLTKRWILQRILAAALGRMSFHCIVLQNKPSLVSRPSGKAVGSSDQSPAYRNNQPLQLWGLTLGMTMDLLAPTFQTNPPRHFLLTQVMNLPLPGKRKSSASSLNRYGLGGNITNQNYSPGTYTLFPRFTYLDVDFLVWCFAHRYRRLAHRRMMSTTSASVANSPHHSRHATPSHSPTSSTSTNTLPPPPSRIHHHSLAVTYYYSAVRRGLVAAAILRVLTLLVLLRLGWKRWMIPFLLKKRSQFQ